MFRRATLFWSCLLLATAGWTTWQLTRIGDADRAQARQLTDRMPLPQTKTTSHRGLYSQERLGVRRDLWAPSSDGPQLALVQRSRSATLAADQQQHTLLEELADVHSVLQENVEMHCDIAKLDREGGYGCFESQDSDGNETIMRGEWVQADGEVIPISLHSRRMEVWMESSRTIRECVADGQARLQYGDGWIAIGDRVTYIRDSADARSLHGIVTLVADRPAGCLVRHAEGSHVYADSVVVNSAAQQLTLLHAKGRLCIPQTGEKKAAHSTTMHLDFESDHALWNHAGHELTLSGNVVIREESRCLASTGDVRIVFDEVNHIVTVRELECRGPTEMTLGDDTGRLRCQGVTSVDFLQQQMTLTSPSDAQGKVHADHQLSFDGPQGDLTSDQLLIQYALQGHEVTPTQITAQGRVCLARETASGGMQYALADTLAYCPTDGSMQLYALSPRRVIFFDKQYDVKVSAPEVQITRDARTHQEKIRGIGDLRMTFLDQEMAHLRQRFTIEEQKKS